MKEEKMSIYEFNSRVRYSECGEGALLTPEAIVNYFQDTATFQGEDLGIGVGYLKKRNLAWILSSWQIVMDHFPVLGENITLQTWAYDFHAFYGLRNLTLKDSSGAMAAWANSVWVLMDMKRQRPVKVPQELTERYGLAPKLEMDYAPRKIDEPEGGRTMQPFTVTPAHLDTNHHVNNGQYIQMAGRCLPEGFGTHEIRAEYKAQAHLGDVITPNVTDDENGITVALRGEDSKSYAVVRFTEKRAERI